jgi:hypothetical protein
VRSAKLEEIRLAILQNLLQFHPESGEQLAWGTAAARAGGLRPLQLLSSGMSAAWLLVAVLRAAAHPPNPGGVLVLQAAGQQPSTVGLLVRLQPP